MRRWWSTSSGEPDQAGSVPVQWRNGELHVCLIRRLGARGWGIPKGHIEDGDTPVETALTEAREEAGLVGRIDDPLVGTYSYWKWEGRLTVAVYVMQVVHMLSVWDEMDIRERRWTTLDEAGRLLEPHPVSPLWRTIASVATRSAVPEPPKKR
jgi:8-oxo-dGTP pyrophosphatase MutT (NUDIX family)